MNYGVRWQMKPNGLYMKRSGMRGANLSSRLNDGTGYAAANTDTPLCFIYRVNNRLL